MAAREHALPRPAPHTVLALGAYLKNKACALDRHAVFWSGLHGDLGQAPHCAALETSAEALLATLPQRPEAIAHDLHPDFYSTRLALTLAQNLGLPAIAIQHHHAHLALVAAEQGLREPVLGWALDGVGLGSDGTAWGGELLWLDASQRSVAWQRVAHLSALALPGGDRAAREPWRMAAAVLHALGRGDEIVPRFAPQVGRTAALTVQQMLQRGLNCPMTTSAGRWFDAAAAALGLHSGVQTEAEAALALEAQASMWLAANPPPRFDGEVTLDLAAVVGALFDLPPTRRGEGAARFHVALAHALAQAALRAARERDVATVVLGGGCFFNRVLSQQLTTRLEAGGLRVLRPDAAGCGDAGLALGQAWIASWTLQHGGVDADAAALLATTE